MRLFVSVLLCTFCASALAQSPPPVDPASRSVAYFTFVDAGQPAVRVDLWGDVSMPGIYRVQQGTDLQELLFLAGGPSERVVQQRQRRDSSVELYRNSAEGWHVYLTAPLDEVMTRRVAIPPLAEGDVVRVRTVVRPRFSWREALSLTGTVASIGLVIWRITDGGR